MARTSIRPLVDKLLDGQLAARLGGWRAEGLSYNDIATELDKLVDYRVTNETVRRWCADLLVEPASEQATA